MANEAKENKKVETPAPGAEVSSDNGNKPETPENTESKTDQDLGGSGEVAPQWAIDLKDTCNQVLAAIDRFNENASRVVKDIIDEAKDNGSKGSKSITTSNPSPAVKINKKAKYVVAKGKAFHSSVSGAIVKEGTDITGLETERLEKLIAHGIAVEKSEED